MNREEYTPYGETSFGSFARKRYRFTGKERDEENGLYYHGARYYAHWIAEWLSCDPKIGQDGGSLYTYVSNRPVNLFDPTGEDEEDNPPGKATVASETIHLTDPYEDPSHPSWIKEAFKAFMLGDKSLKAQHRYDSLETDQSFYKGLMDRNEGCTGCHIATQVWNTWGPQAFNPKNNLPYDWAINQEGYRTWAMRSAQARFFVEGMTMIRSTSLVVGQALKPQFSFATDEAWTFAGRKIRILNTPSGPKPITEGPVRARIVHLERRKVIGFPSMALHHAVSRNLHTLTIQIHRYHWISTNGEASKRKRLVIG